MQDGVVSPRRAALASDPRLDAAAWSHSQEMSQTGVLDHM